MKLQETQDGSQPSVANSTYIPKAITSGISQPFPKFPHNLPHKLQFILSQNGIAYLVVSDNGNSYVLRVGSRQLNNIIRSLADSEGITIRKHDLIEINEYLTAYVEMSGEKKHVWSRVAPIDGGVEIDMCDDNNTRIRVSADGVEIINQGSNTLFLKSAVSEQMVIPTQHGDLTLLKKYVNLSDIDFLLLSAWLSYTLGHPKIKTSKYLILVLQGDQGTGKSFISQLIIKLLDPNRVGVQIFPANAKDLTIAAQNAHVLCYDNMRGFKNQMADILCVASTGGAISNRALYTDADQHVHNLHVALVLNGIHSFINQSDLAQRCLSIRTRAMPESRRKSEAAMTKELETDLPVILRGLLNLMADVFKHLPNAEVTSPERMLDFVYWLAAMEKVNGVPTGVYQSAYSTVLHETQLDSLMDNALAAAIIEFSDHSCMKAGNWTGTPADLLDKLELMISDGTKRSLDWPKSPSTLSKRLNSLKASLLTQGVAVEFSRGKHRTITIKNLGDDRDQNKGKSF